MAVAASAALSNCRYDVPSGRPLGGSDGLLAVHIGMDRFHRAAVAMVAASLRRACEACAT